MNDIDVKMNWKTSPLPYMLQVLEFATSQSPIWSHFEKNYHAENKQLEIDDLIKGSYIITPNTHSVLFDALNWVVEKMDLKDIHFEIYQQEQSKWDNAQIIFNNKEAVILLAGKAWQEMNLEVLKALLAHECAHYYLLHHNDGKFAICIKILQALANEHYHSAIFEETIRKFQLYTEIYCDRVAYQLLQQVDPMIELLITISSGLKKVDVAGYIVQAQKIVTKDPHFTSEQYTHPENFIRALSLLHWHENKEEADQLITALIAPQTVLHRMDYFDQQYHQKMTKQILNVLMQHSIMQNEWCVAHAQTYFPKFSMEKVSNKSFEIPNFPKHTHESFLFYYAYILHDFTLLDHDLDDFAIAWTYFLSTKLGIATTYEKILMNEWKCSIYIAQKNIHRALNQYENQLYI